MGVGNPLITLFFQDHTQYACCGKALVQGQDSYPSYTKSPNVEPLRQVSVLLETLDHKLPNHFNSFWRAFGAESSPPGGKAPAEDSTCYPCSPKPGTHYKNMIPVAQKYI